ncbi:LPXTG cell wall anchor domain-containing protein [Streptomyces sp. NBC_01016]|uniref:LPXTG cell wall anchor domain-containing protein n=1 Tax=Streptomyces sp. NBC_01016 TaxID=2903720 RepID=UPI0022522BDB|nr:LPXTG cell wall anchor domain-containing protein [Streptomyces sp. NBC_01016]MCX4832573.1 LPXTG cell wall anchor domain-containing protein [Streptomyces sp. NBC_01016]
MGSRRQVKIAGTLCAGAVTAFMVLPGAALADHGPGPGSGEGGKAVDAAPSGVKLTTALPKKISADNSTGETQNLIASVSNQGSKGSGRIFLAVVGFDGLVVKDVPNCTAIPENKLPKGSNSGFSCPIDNLKAGKTQSYKVAATFDLKKTGKICLPVQSGDTKKTFWQQGPVPFGTTSPSPNAPVTPLLLNTENEPAAPAGDKGDEGGGGSGGANDQENLPSTGVGDAALPLGAVGAALMAAGGAGLWWTRRGSSEVR